MQIMFEIIPSFVFIIFMFILGSFFGSFLNVVIYRMPRKCKSILKPRRSFCPKCLHNIAWYDNIPIFSYIFLNGKCRHCKEVISIRYPIVEFLTAALFVVFMHLDVLTVKPENLEYHHFLSLAMHLVATFILIAIAFIDYDLMIIPDTLSIGGAIIMLGFAFVNPFHGGYKQDVPNMQETRRVSLNDGGGFSVRNVNYQHYAIVGNQKPVGSIVNDTGWISEEKTNSRSFFSALFSAIGGGWSMFLLSVIMTLVFLKKAQKYGGGLALGMGDVKLMILFGAMLGWPALPLILIIGSFIGVIFGVPQLFTKSKHVIPFGPALASAAIVIMVFYGPILNWVYKNIFLGQLFL